MCFAQTKLLCFRTRYNINLDDSGSEAIEIMTDRQTDRQTTEYRPIINILRIRSRDRTFRIAGILAPFL